MTPASPTPGEPADLEALAALADGQLREGRLAEAAATYRKILALRPDDALVCSKLGDVLLALGQFDVAAAQYEQALALQPDLFEARNNLARILCQQGKFDQAIQWLQQMIALRPDYAPAHNNLAHIFRTRGNLDAAATHYQQALTLRPGDVEAHNHLGNVLLAKGQLDGAIAQYQQAVGLRPGHFPAHNSLGDIFHKQGKLEQAAAHYRQAIALRPDLAETHNNLGAVLARQGNLDAAIAHCQRALTLKPGLFQAHNNLGNIFRMQGELDPAAAHYERALAVEPAYAEAHKNLGHVLRSQGQLDEAMARYEHALALRPGYAEAEMGLAAGYLLRGDYERGWPAYEARLRMPGPVPRHNVPRWNGEPLAGRSLLLLAEQGLGDTIQFVRYARILKGQGARVVLAVQPPLGRLLASHPEVDEIFILGSAKELPRTDFYLPLLSVAGVLGTTIATIPRDVPYLAADPELSAHWRQELAASDGFKIGIAWQGARDFRLDRWRSIPLADFAPLAALPGVRLISLQKGFGSEQIATADFPLVDLAGRLDETAGPFMDTAAVIGAVDLVVAPDTAIAHLAGALGVPVWVALPFSADWRWLMGRDDSPWYPTMRLFRQTTIGGWPDVFLRMADALQARRSGTA